MSSRPYALIIEDDAQLSRIFDLTLRGDFEIETIADGDEAFTRLLQIVPDLILLDLNLPGKSGKDLLQWIRKDPRFQNTHIFLCTADSVQAEMLRDEADIVFLKPVSPTQLKEIATRFMDLFRAQS